MNILSSTAVSSIATTLTVAAQPLTAQATSNATTAAMAATDANTPAAVYYPSEPAQSEVASEPVEAIETWIGRGLSANFPQAAALHSANHDTLKSAFATFQSTLAKTYPALASQPFGFTVDTDGNLQAFGTAGSLSAADLGKLNTLLNASSDLKTAAVNYRDSAIELVAADSPWAGNYMGGYNLTKDNFSKTIDLAQLFAPTWPAPLGGSFYHQLATKGEPMTQASEAAMLAARGQ